jgi:alkanesulfonate monooxygenase SsuD/methylene tetrahydromethanopterin reductase-like flavin-dependent oxidoreductase (luciferase family)
MEEQVTVLRLLWTQPLVKFEGRWHTIPDAGLNPLPMQQPIPIWFGGTDDRALKRAVLLGDGWMPNDRTIEAALPHVDKINQYLEETGRERDTFGIEPRLNMSLIKPEQWAEFRQAWEKLGATHLTVNTMGCEYESASAHLEALQRFAREAGIG